MQVHGTAMRTGIPSPTASVDPFQGLGDLPGLGHVDAGVQASARPLRHALVLMPPHVVPFPDLREARCWTVPASPLLRPLAWHDDVTRRPLAERAPAVPGPGASPQRGRKRTREGEDGSAGEPLAFADARDGLSLALPDGHNLEDVVAAMARQLLREPAPPWSRRSAPAKPAAFVLGHALCQQLGGTMLADAPRDRVLRAVLQLALPPWESGIPDSAQGCGGLGPLALADSQVLGQFLSGFGEGLGGVSAPDHPFNRALVDMASRLGFDPLRVPGRLPSVIGYSRRSGPLQLAAHVLLDQDPSVSRMNHFLDALLSPLAMPTAPLAAVLSVRERAVHLSHLLASLAPSARLPSRDSPVPLAPVFALMRQQPRDCIEAFVCMVASVVRYLPEGAEHLGIGVARALAGVRSDAVNLTVLACLGRIDPSDAAAQGRLVRGYLRAACAVAPCHEGWAAEFGAYWELVRHAPQLDAQALCQLMFRLAVADGLDGDWAPASERVDGASRLGLCLSRTASGTPERQRAALHGLLAAVRYLGGKATPGFEDLAHGLRDQADALCPPGHAQRNMALDISGLVADPHHLFNATHQHEAPSTVALHLHLMLDLVRHSPLPLAFLNRCVAYVLSSPIRMDACCALLLRLVQLNPLSVQPGSVVQVRQCLLQGLAAQRWPHTDRLPRPAVASTLAALRSIYTFVLPGSRIRCRAEIAALESTHVLAHEGEAVQPLIDLLRAADPPRSTAPQAVSR